MSKTYRALGIVAIVATLLGIGSELWFTHASLNGWFSFAPVNTSNILGIPTGLLTLISLPLTTLAAPVVSTFAVVVAAQARRWGWLVAFVLLGLFGMYGPTALFLLEPYLGLARPMRAAGLDAIAPQILALALPAIAALIFVASARPRQPVAGAERASIQPQ